MSQSEALIFLKEDSETATVEPMLKPWKVAIIDDDEQIHVVTKLALGDFSYQNRSLEFISAYSAKEGKVLFEQNNDIAICLLDVVMETDTAGLDLIKIIRQNHNEFTRVVLRTGQPGQAPAEDVIKTYDINDYKEKTELTHTKLVTLMYSCLKTYDSMIKQEKTRLGLEKVLDSATHIFKNPHIEEFTEGVLLQLTSLFDFDENAAFYKIEHGIAMHVKEQQMKIISSIGDYDFDKKLNSSKSLGSRLMDDALASGEKFIVVYDSTCFLASYFGNNQEHYMLFLRGRFDQLSDIHLKIVSLFCHNALIAFENVYLNNEVEEGQSEIVNLLGGAVETRSKETGNHIKRVAILSELLGQKLNLDDKLVEFIRLGSPLHDVGKIAIPDAILNKPGKLEPEEWELMKTHAEKGYEMLQTCKNRVMKVAANIALEHHEKWDGSGYPNGKAGKAICIEGRITSVADVFDALCSKRCYKDAWSYQQAFDYMLEHSGTQFDPELIDILLNEKETIIDIYQEYQD